MIEPARRVASSELDTRLARGPLRVRTLSSPGSPERLARRVLQRKRSLFALDAIAVSGCLALVLLFSGRRLGFGPSEDGAPTASAVAAGMVTAFADGSVAEASSRETQLHVEQDTPNWVVTKVTGGARFHVVPNHERTFEVRAGDVRVRVLGTTFSVEELPSGQTQVFVEHGSVEVAWLGGGVLLKTGQGGTFPPSTEAEAEPETVGDQPAPQAQTQPAARGVRPASGWRDEARAGNYGKAYEELNARGRDAVRDEASDLMLAADVARLSAHPEEAIRPLRAVCDRHASDRRAPVAAFTLGRVLLDDLGRGPDAAVAFKKARTLWPEGPLAEDALAREADAWARAGRAEASHTANEYLSRYPQGRHAAAMRKILAP